jgi:hypothetical protein
VSENQWCQTPFPVRDHVLRAKSQQPLGCLVPQGHLPSTFTSMALSVVHCRMSVICFMRLFNHSFYLQNDTRCPWFQRASSRLRKNYVGTRERRWSARVAQQENTPAGCSKRPSSKAAASEDPRRYPTALRVGRSPVQWILANGKALPVFPRSEAFLLKVEGLNDARTKLVDFFSILLGVAPGNSIQLGQPHRRLTIAWRAIVASRR